ncbi:hypothetical protein IU501_09285 [Nocardia otitidiscaviarum]|uniref:hypothetical protein n=1 Tax=Nocardia otitidiscaviarum TaxID=1823 RepID=UPI0011DCAE7D|nr:hypothetical protein [Nocardia otitidiscaviarum]MBF6133192.1 hypothetical protein [Nocardia otitidiscaviarum]MBF6240914.1 hypothetical protein [Nocardia otitidiscaviarum]MBF6486588.1 hypothetical protein [Nocardia otitidiscaviarum]
MGDELGVGESAQHEKVVESAGQRFGRQLKAFRQRNLPDELITHQHIHELGGPTRNVQSRIESGQVDTISATSEAKYNRALEALGLPPGSATAALHHGGTLGMPVDEPPAAPMTDDADDVESGVNALQNLARKHRSVVDLVTELDRLGIELKRARSHTDGYQLIFPKTAIDQLLQALQDVAKPTRASDESTPDDTSKT